MKGGISPWWAKDRFGDRRPFLQKRAVIAGRLRQLFADNGFTEVETGILQVSPGNETHLHALASELTSPQGERARLYLRTSPEFATKKLLAAGEPRLFELADRRALAGMDVFRGQDDI